MKKERKEHLSVIDLSLHRLTQLHCTVAHTLGSVSMATE